MVGTVGNKLFEISVVLHLSGLNFEPCFCQVCYVSSLFLSLRTKSNARAQFQLDFFSPATKLFALLGGASKQHSLTGLDFWVDFLWRLFMAELERQPAFAVEKSSEAREKSSEEGSEVTGPKRNKTGAYV